MMRAQIEITSVNLVRQSASGRVVTSTAERFLYLHIYSQPFYDSDVALT